MTAQEMPPAPQKNRHWRAIAALLVAVVALSGAAFAFRRLGEWLVVEDPLQHADAIAVLSGSMPFRAIEAAEIFRQGLAPEVWLTRPSGPTDLMARLGLEYTNEETYNAEVLIKLGVPADAIHVLPDPILNTENEVRLIANTLRHDGKHRVIIVTSPPHTRRVRALWRKLIGTGPKAIVRRAEKEPYDAAHWWRDTRDSLAVTRETLGLLNVWAGLPFHPSPR
jgi:uncharacterized SAM-binding protein YcdF (DUF218 family)